MVLAFITNPTPSSKLTNAPRYWIDLALDGEFSRSVPGLVLGDWSVLLTVAAGLTVLLGMLRLDRQQQLACGGHGWPGLPGSRSPTRDSK